MRASVYMRVRGVEGEGQESPLSSREPRALLGPGVRLCYLTCESPAEPCESSLILRPGCGSSSRLDSQICPWTLSCGSGSLSRNNGALTFCQPEYVMNFLAHGPLRIETNTKIEKGLWRV